MRALVGTTSSAPQLRVSAVTAKSAMHRWASGTTRWRPHFPVAALGVLLATLLEAKPASAAMRPVDPGYDFWHSARSASPKNAKPTRTSTIFEMRFMALRAAMGAVCGVFGCCCCGNIEVLKVNVSAHLRACLQFEMVPTSQRFLWLHL